MSARKAHDRQSRCWSCWLVLGGMAVFGIKSALAPLPGSGSSSKDPTCSDTEKEIKQFLKRSEVQVSVFNAGTREGLAGETLEKLEEAGFKAGNAGNAPGSAEVRRAVVWTTTPNDPSAKLVALALGGAPDRGHRDRPRSRQSTCWSATSSRGWTRRRRQRIRLPKPIETCIEVD